MGGVAAVAGGVYGVILACWSVKGATAWKETAAAAEEEEEKEVSAPTEPLVSPTLLKGKRQGGEVGGPRSGRSRSRGPTSARKRK